MLQKLGRSLKLHNSEASSLASFCDFRSKISSFINQILLKPEPGSVFLSLKWFQKCFELIHVSHRAFAKFVVEIDFPIARWGEKSMEEYLNYTLNLLDILNSIISSLSHLNQAKISVSHALNRTKNSPSSQLKKIPEIFPGTKYFKLEKSKTFGMEGGLSSISEKESLVLEALMILKKTGFLSLSLVLSGLCSDAKPYLDTRKFMEGCDDSIVKSIDLRFCKEILDAKGIMKEVKETNDAVESMLSKGGDEALEELRRRLEVLEISIDGMKKQANNLFSEVLAIRSKLIDSLRFTGKNSQHHKKV